MIDLVVYIVTIRLLNVKKKCIILGHYYCLLEYDSGVI